MLLKDEYNLGNYIPVTDTTAKIRQGECLEVLRPFPENTFISLSRPLTLEVVHKFRNRK
jgi:hypothetical protein